MAFLEVPGGVIAAIEVTIFAVIATIFRKKIKCLQTLDAFSYYWLSFTILTGIWELTFVFNREYVRHLAETMLAENKRVWTAHYDLTYVLPNKLAHIFYAQYGGYADREYMVTKDPWSAVVEGTHAFLCALFSVVGMIGLHIQSNTVLLVGICAAMGSQLMNSVMYMAEYEIQTGDPTSVNYDSAAFPEGYMWSKRPFMYVNIFWTIFPAYILTFHICRGAILWIREKKRRIENSHSGAQPLVEMKHAPDGNSRVSRSSGSDTSSQNEADYASPNLHSVEDPGQGQHVEPLYGPGELEEYISHHGRPHQSQQV